MKVLLAETMGFCFGVEDAIELAEEATHRAEKVYALGPLIHNKQVIQKMADAGLSTVKTLDEVSDGSVLIRAHGVGPDTMKQARERSLGIVDATCVLVRRAQNTVRQLHEEGYAVVLVGDKEHPEVKGIIGHAPNVTIIADRGELHKLPNTGRIGVVAQTTLSQSRFADVVAAMLLRQFREMKVVNTLCVEVVRRQQAAIALCANVDVMFVLGGLHSANTRELAQLCIAQNTPTHHLESWEQFRDEYVSGTSIAGVTAGASTPQWVIDRFVQELKAYDEEKALSSVEQSG